MDIKKVQAYVTQTPLMTPEHNSRVSGEEKTQGSFAETDSVQLSKEYIEVNRAKKLMMDRSDEIRTDKIEPIQRSIENKTYAIDAEKIAQKMMDELWW
ncbi:MAG: flagellar biosynthesis anti-sigma factor FlgM [Syntrophobacteraceae bacterium]|nr:flagellar biosynthesis anti-sigma factor FlgM [Syntrophobacteraceae bacterium]